MYCLINDKLLPIEQASIPVTDQIIQRGVGVFDLSRSCGEGLVQLTNHMQRLIDSAELVNICVPWSVEELKSFAFRLRRSLEGEVLVKVFITGGDHFGPDGFDAPRLFGTVEPLKLPDAELKSGGVKLCPLDYARSNPSAKTVDYAATFGIHQLDPSAFEALYCPDGKITEGAHSTFYAVIDGKLLTAPDEAVLPGTTRAIILNAAEQMGLKIEKRFILLDELAKASEAFISGSVKGVLPVRAVGDRVIPSIGEWTKKFSAHLTEELRQRAEIG